MAVLQHIRPWPYQSCCGAEGCDHISLLVVRRCRLDGEALQGLVVGQLAKLTLAARDRFGNACASGGEDVDVELRGPAGLLNAPQQCAHWKIIRELPRGRSCSRHKGAFTAER